MTKRFPGAKSLAQMKAKLTPAQRAAVAKRARALRLEEMSLADLRKAQNLTQAELAKKLGLRQATISEVKSRSDLYMSTLRKHIEALGGALELVATFPNRPPISVTGLDGHGEERQTTRKRA